MLRIHSGTLLMAGTMLALIAGCGEERARKAVGPAASPSAKQDIAALEAPRYSDSGVAESQIKSLEEAAPTASAASPLADGDLNRELQKATTAPSEGQGPGQGGDKFAYTEENPFLQVKDSPLSTFSIDVDTASYSKTRAYLLQHHSLPPADAVRIEEMINYFDYSYSGPTDEHPFAVHIEMAACPWQPAHRLVRFGIQGKKMESKRPVSNLVFLLDVSGSMNETNKLPLVKYALRNLVNQLGENDRVSIVVYAGAAGMVLPPTSGEDHQGILGAIENLHAGGSTNGGQGIHLAYQLAEENFIQGGVNRILLCTDGDFNVGTTSTGDLVRLAIEKAKSGVFLSVLGFGFGNHNDAMLEQIADKANGNYAFIDSEAEARKVLVEQLAGTLVTIAKDVKIQVEFNPALVASYRLIGYENRKLADRDFNDDKKDAGEIGAGHSVTVLYEVVPAGADSSAAKPEVDPLKYQKPAAEVAGKSEFADELLTLKMRYQPPAGGTSTLMTFPVKDGGAKFGASSADLQFATAVASFGMLLRNSQFKGDTSYAAVLETAQSAKGEDKFGYRAEFIEMVKAAQRLSGANSEEKAIPTNWTDGRNSLGLIVPQPTNVAANGPTPVLRCGVVDRPSAFPWLDQLNLSAGLLFGTGAALIALAMVVALVSVWNYSPLPRQESPEIIFCDPPRRMK